MSQRVAIVGIGQTYHKARRPDVSHLEMTNEAVRAALEDAQLTIKDIDAVLLGNMELFEGHYLTDSMFVDGSGAYMKPGMKLNTGGTVGGAMLVAAWYHVASGLFDTVLTIGTEKLDEGQTTSAIITAIDAINDRPFSTGAIGGLAMMANRYIGETGCRVEHAAMVRAKAAHNAARNPHAHLRNPLTVDDVLKSRMVVYPIRLLDMCPTSSGACAMVLASEKKAKRITKKPVWVKDQVVCHQEAYKLGMEADPMPSLSSQMAAAQKLYRRNGIAQPRKDIDVFEMYDPCSWAELNWMEDFLLCDKGESWKLVEKGVTELGGEFPINPSGGVQCTNPIGATAMIRVAEAALQVRGDGGEHQVSRDVKTAVATAFGGSNWTIMTLLSKNL